MKIDYEKEMFQIKKNIRFAVIFVISAVILLAAAITLFLVFATYENRLLMKIIGIPVIALLGVLLCFLIVNFLAASIQKQKSMYNILYAYQEEFDGTIIAIKSNVHLSVYKEGYEISVQSGEEVKTVYLPIFVENIDLEVNQNIHFVVAKNFVISYEKK